MNQKFVRIDNPAFGAQPATKVQAGMRNNQFGSNLRVLDAWRGELRTLQVHPLHRLVHEIRMEKISSIFSSSVFKLQRHSGGILSRPIFMEDNCLAFQQHSECFEDQNWQFILLHNCINDFGWRLHFVEKIRQMVLLAKAMHKMIMKHNIQ